MTLRGELMAVVAISIEATTTLTRNLANVPEMWPVSPLNDPPQAGAELAMSPRRCALVELETTESCHETDRRQRRYINRRTMHDLSCAYESHGGHRARPDSTLPQTRWRTPTLSASSRLRACEGLAPARVP